MICLFPFYVQAQSEHKQLIEANQFYTAENYDKAAENYERILQEKRCDHAILD